MVSGSPFGSTPFGLATPVAAPLPATKGPALSRYINSDTGDFELDTSTGQMRAMPALRQRVLLIAKTTWGSSAALPTLGIRRPPKMDQTFESRMRAEVRRAYRQLTDIERVMIIEGIEIQRAPGAHGRAAVTLIYRDLTNPTPDLAQRDVIFTV